MFNVRVHPMRILWLHQYFATPRGWGAVRTFEFARRFAQAGHDVHVVCCAGYDDTLSDGLLVAPGVQIHLSSVKYAPRMGFARRLWAFFVFMLHSIGTVLAQGGRFDLVIASSGPLSLAVPALMGKWFRRLPYVFEVIDVWPDSAIAAGVLKNPMLQWCSHVLERLAYRQAIGVVTCSTGMTRRVLGKIAAWTKKPWVETVSNSCDLDDFRACETRRETIRMKQGVLPGQVVVLYTGAMGVSNAIDDLVTAIRTTAGRDDILWWLAGTGRDAAKLQALAGGPVKFFGSMPKADLIDLYCGADLNVITFLPDLLFEENSPNKFFDGIAAGLPALFNRSTWLQPWLDQYGCGVICDGIGNASLGGSILQLADDATRRAGMRIGAKRLAQEVFSRDLLAAQYLAHIEKPLCSDSVA